jgi:uncharacterized protein (TIGR03083 family)
MDTWTQVRNGREAFGNYLSNLSADDWSKQSLCADWSAKDLVAHMLVIPTMSKGQVFRAFLGSRFNLDRMNAKLVGKLTATMSTSQLAAATTSSAASHGMPPGLKLPGVLNELVIHSADVAEGVGKPFDLPTADYVSCLAYLQDVQPVFGAKQRIAGLRLQATDSEWSTGSAGHGYEQVSAARDGRPTRSLRPPHG